MVVVTDGGGGHAVAISVHHGRGLGAVDGISQLLLEDGAWAVTGRGCCGSVGNRGPAGPPLLGGLQHIEGKL